MSGVIEAIGNDVTGFEVGQRVVAAMRNGGQSSHVTAPISRVIPIPDNIGLDEAAAMPVTYLTAHHMLHHLGHLEQGQSVLLSTAVQVVWERRHCNYVSGQGLSMFGQRHRVLRHISSKNTVANQ